MSSTFLGLTIGYSGLAAYQAALHTTGNNLANVQTKGYCRQQVTRVPSEEIRAYAKYGTVGTGVTAVAIEQLRDTYYDYKYWDNCERYGEHYTKHYYMDLIQRYIEEENQKGITNALSGFDSALEDLLKTPEDFSTRNALIHSSSNIAKELNTLVESWETVQEDCNEEIKSRVDQINSIAQQLIVLNKQISMVEVTGEKANELRDARNLLIDELSSVCDVEVEEKAVPSNMKDAYGNFIYTGQTTYSVKIDGQLLVKDFSCNALEVRPREVKNNQSDIDGLYDIYWKNGQDFNMKSTSVGGYLQGLIAIRDGNNAENLQGSIDTTKINTTENSVTITNPNITDITKMNMPESGKIILNSKEFTYDRFEYDPDTKEYKFYLTKPLTAADQTLLSKPDGKAAVGNTVDYCGIPYYMSKLNEFVRCYAMEANRIHTQGQIKIDGNFVQAGNMYTSAKPAGGDYTFADGNKVGTNTDTYYNMVAKYFKVTDELMDDPNRLAVTSNLAQGSAGTDIAKLFKEMKDSRIINGATPSQYFEAILSDISVGTQSAKQNMDNYNSLGNSITNQRLSVSGVDEDEEGIDLVKFQHAYNLSSKVISVLSEVYDKLILDTGV
ncbi:MAG: flagellar hook-associated protein FlgK [Lachnospiraceae bacterium]|nr:flagellar hook-associated protein FlgK [Lachnospiraceae bacterium]